MRVDVMTDRLTAADMEWVWAVYQATTRAQNDEALGWTPEQHYQRRWGELCRGAFSAILVDGHRVGLIELTEEDDALNLRHLEVLPEHQARGIGTAVNEAVAEEARRRGMSVTLRVLHKNVRARALYERLGFRVERLRENSVQMRLGFTR